MKSNDSNERSTFDRISLLFAESFMGFSFGEVALTLFSVLVMFALVVLLIVGMIFMIIYVPATIIIPIVIFSGAWLILETNKRAKEINGRGYLS